jgi:hypothetical protein
MVVKNSVLDPDSGFDEQKLEKITSEKNDIFLIKNCNLQYLFLGLHKGRPSYRRNLQPSKRTSST